MSLTKEDLRLIGELFEQKFDEKFDQKFDQKFEEKFGPVNARLDKIESRLDVVEYKQDRFSEKLNNLQLDVKIAERDIRRDIHALNDQMETVIEVLKRHELLPL